MHTKKNELVARNIKYKKILQKLFKKKEEEEEEEEKFKENNFINIYKTVCIKSCCYARS